MTMTEVRKKIHTVRSRFQRERKLMKESAKSGAGADQVYTPKLWFFDLLIFINDSNALQESTSTLDEYKLHDSNGVSK